MRFARLAIITTIVFIFSSGAIRGQAGSTIQPTGLPPIDTPSDPQFEKQRGGAKEPFEVQAEKERDKQLQKKRYQDIKKQSEKLLEVATELKQYVDKSGENVLSLDVIKKAQEMEKLSRDLQKKMKGE